MSSGTSKGLMRTKFVISLCSFLWISRVAASESIEGARDEFFDVLAIFGRFLLSLERVDPRRSYRKDLGETPSRRLVCFARWLWSEKPTDMATSKRVSSVLVKSSFARSTRLRTTYWCGERPVERLNRLEKW